jgi:hypothetical protein
MSGAAPRYKGGLIEREIADGHGALDVHAERFPLSGASRFRGSDDVDVYPFGRDNAPIVAEMKSRRSGAGFAALERWLGKYGPLFLSRNNTDPLVALPWSVLARIIGVVRS